MHMQTTGHHGSPSPPLGPPRDDSIILLHGASWEDYERIMAIRGDTSSPKINYLDGTIELMSPSRNHESPKGAIGCMVEAWCFAHDIPFQVRGAETLELKPKCAIEPDESYTFGREIDDNPDLAIEVVWTSGGVDKLSAYAQLGVREVWFYIRGELSVHRLGDDGAYREVEASEALPGIDLEHLVACLEEPTTFDAVKRFQRGL